MKQGTLVGTITEPFFIGKICGFCGETEELGREFIIEILNKKEFPDYEYSHIIVYENNLKVLSSFETNFMAYVVANFPKQNSFCINNTQCVYWDKKTGKKCVIGITIPEDKYHEDFDYYMLSPLDVINNFCNITLSKEFINFINAIQEWHDQIAQKKVDFKYDLFILAMKEICQDHDIQYPEDHLIKMYSSYTPEKFWEEMQIKYA